MRISSIFPLLAALAVTAKAELATSSYHINSLNGEGYFVGIYDKDVKTISKSISILRNPVNWQVKMK